MFLNHGSYGAATARVLGVQHAWRDRMDAEPVRFFTKELPKGLAYARRSLAEFLGCDTDGLVFQPNATIGVATALASVDLGEGDEVVVNRHEYASCLNEIERESRRRGFAVRVAEIPFPIRSSDEAYEAVMAAVSGRTRLVLLSWVTSATALVLPVERLVAELRRRGVISLVDAAHAPGQVEMNIAALGADYVTGNLHKWVCAPKGSGFLWIAPEHRERVEPLALSSRAAWVPEGGNRLHHVFDYVGTNDYTPWLAIPEALNELGSMLPGGWGELRERNRSMCLEARDIVCGAIGAEPPAPDDMIAHIASITLPPLKGEPPPDWGDPLWLELQERHAIQVPVWTSSALGVRALRLSAQLYNTPEQFEYLARVLPGALAASSRR